MAPLAATKKRRHFDPKTFLSISNGGRKIVAFPKKQTIFVQGDSSDAVFYIQKGKIKLTVVSKTGKEAIIGILKEGDFFAFLAATFGRRQLRQNPLPNVEVARYLGSRGVSDGQLRNLHKPCFNRVDQSEIANHPRERLVRRILLDECRVGVELPGQS